MTFKTFFLTLSSHVGIRKLLLHFLLVLGTTLGLRKEIGVRVGGRNQVLFLELWAFPPFTVYLFCTTQLFSLAQK